MDGLVAGLTQGHGQPMRDEADMGATDTTGGRPEFVKWVKVATTVGHSNAVIISGRLESNNIPTRITQEAAGSSVLPVNVGMLSQAQVWVPEEYEAAACALLAHDADEEE